MKSPIQKSRFLHGHGAPWRYLAYALIIGLLANLSALINLFLHPEIPYLDGCNGIVGGILALLAAILCIMLESNIRKRDPFSAAAARLGAYPWILVVLWTVLIGASLAWSIYSKRQEIMTEEYGEYGGQIFILDTTSPLLYHHEKKRRSKDKQLQAIYAKAEALPSRIKI
ncbi:hypothetical protein ACUUL3_04080 [Thiovibrio sp. JS02]